MKINHKNFWIQVMVALIWWAIVTFSPMRFIATLPRLLVLSVGAVTLGFLIGGRFPLWTRRP